MILSLDVTAAHVLNTIRCTKGSVKKDCGLHALRVSKRLYRIVFITQTSLSNKCKDNNNDVEYQGLRNNMYHV
jgi:hypothetical protein